MGFLHEQQRADAFLHVKFNCLALDDYLKAARYVNSLREGPGGEPAFYRGMPLQDKMKLV